MSRLRPFVILDVLVTLPLFVYGLYDTLKHPEPGMQWLHWIILGCAFVVMFPSFVCLAGKSLNHIVAAMCLLLYLALLVFMWFGLLHRLHDSGPPHGTLIRVGIILLIAKSIWGVISVTKYDTT